MDNFYIFKSQIEQDIMYLAKETQSIIANVNNKTDAKCRQRTFNQCQTTAHKYCINDFPWQPQCFTKGAKISYHSGLRFPNDIQINKTGRCIICETTSLDPIFRKIKIQSLYVGLFIGTFRRFPSQQQENIDGKCKKSYDPRKRFWYVGASTGPKNMIIIIDLSKQISQEQLEYTKKAVQSLITTLTFNDFFSVILYSNTAKKLLYQNLIRAKNEIKNAIISSIRTLRIDTQYQGNIASAFEIAKELLQGNSTQTDIYGSPCTFSTNIVIIITGASNTTDIRLDKWKTQWMVKLFIYHIAKGIDTVLLNMSCLYQGSYFHYNRTVNYSILANDIRIYEKFMLSRLNIDSPVWTEPYDDFFTNLRMITMAMPVYYYHLNGSYKQDNRMIVGVAGVDILMSTLQQYIISQEKVMKQLIKCSITNKIKFDSCTTNHLRNNYSKCSANCPNDREKQIITCPVQVGEKNVFHEIPFNTNISLEQGEDIYFCCSLQLEAGVILVSICFIVLVIISICVGKWYIRKKQKEVKGESQTTHLSPTDQAQSSKSKKTKVNLSEDPKNPGSLTRLGQNQEQNKSKNREQLKIRQTDSALMDSNQKNCQVQINQQ